MCYIWKKQGVSPQLSTGDMDRIFSNAFFNKNTEIINLTGGEPTLRPDLLDIVDILVKRCRNLKRIDMPTNGINTSLVMDKIEAILTRLLPTDVKLAVTVSLDGVDGVHDAVRGVPGIFKNVESTIKEIKEISVFWPGLYFGVNATIGRLNFDKLGEIKEYGRRNQVGVNFTLGAISEIGVESVEMKDNFLLTASERAYVADFFEENIKDKTINEKYGSLAIELLRKGRRQPLCAFRAGKAILIEPDGNVYLCGNYKEFFIGNALKEKTEVIAKNAAGIKGSKWNKCFSCESNCYIDEVL
jgi:MoaA/NifB/PqqE/SkfB family radical SAM enzyme